QAHLDILHKMAETLIKYETIESAQIDDLMAGRTPNPPKDWSEEERKGKPKDETPQVVDSGDQKVDGTIGGPASLH
ncbi:MAG: ATP-dependent zinc metalloprotease FtsH, partial [Gammaproteobacteria bacterium]